MFEPALTNTVKLYRQGRFNLSYLDVSNPNTVSAFLQIFDAAAIADVTLGTTPPLFSIPIPKGASATDVGQKAIPLGFAPQFINGLCMAATTTPTGSTALGAAIGVNFDTVNVVG